MADKQSNMLKIINLILIVGIIISMTFYPDKAQPYIMVMFIFLFVNLVYHYIQTTFFKGK